MPDDPIPPAPAVGGSRTLAEREVLAHMAAGTMPPAALIEALPPGSDLHAQLADLRLPAPTFGEE
jgi:hypothetical protein